MNLSQILVLGAMSASMMTASGLACAQTITYTLENVTFNDDSVATGTFTYNAATEVFTSWSISTTATPAGDSILDNGYPLNAATYTSTGPSGTSTYNSTGFDFDNGTGGFNNGNDIALLFKGGLTSAGGTVQLGSSVGDGSETQNNGFLSRTIVSGEVVGAVPEPSTYVMIVAGLGLLLGMRRRTNFTPQEMSSARARIS